MLDSVIADPALKDSCEARLRQAGMSTSRVLGDDARELVRVLRTGPVSLGLDSYESMAWLHAAAIQVLLDFKVPEKQWRVVHDELVTGIVAWLPYLPERHEKWIVGGLQESIRVFVGRTSAAPRAIVGLSLLVARSAEPVIELKPALQSIRYDYGCLREVVQAAVDSAPCDDVIPAFLMQAAGLDPVVEQSAQKRPDGIAAVCCELAYLTLLGHTEWYAFEPNRPILDKFPIDALSVFARISPATRDRMCERILA